jgi:hypothetical protein
MAPQIDGTDRRKIIGAHVDAIFNAARVSKRFMRDSMLGKTIEPEPLPSSMSESLAASGVDTMSGTNPLGRSAGSRAWVRVVGLVVLVAAIAGGAVWANQQGGPAARGKNEATVAIEAPHRAPAVRRAKGRKRPGAAARTVHHRRGARARAGH